LYYFGGLLRPARGGTPAGGGDQPAPAWVGGNPGKAQKTPPGTSKKSPGPGAGLAFRTNGRRALFGRGKRTFQGLSATGGGGLSVLGGVRGGRGGRPAGGKTLAAWRLFGPGLGPACAVGGDRTRTKPSRFWGLGGGVCLRGRGAGTAGARKTWGASPGLRAPGLGSKCPTNPGGGCPFPFLPRAGGARAAQVGRGGGSGPRPLGGRASNRLFQTRGGTGGRGGAGGAGPRGGGARKGFGNAGAGVERRGLIFVGPIGAPSAAPDFLGRGDATGGTRGLL